MIENSMIASDFFQDSFEGSHDEHCIFNEVFFGDDLSIRSKRCLVTGIINFESDCSESFKSTQCSNSESSPVSQSLCKSLYQNDIYMGYKDELSASGNFPDTSTSLGSVDVVGANYQKGSPDSEGKLGLCSQSKDSVDDTITLHLVESSGQGLTSNCYLLKKDVNLKKFARVDGRLRKSDTGGRKELVGAPGASPVSQESFAPKHVVPSPSFCALERRESCHPVEDRISRLESPCQSEPLKCLGKASKVDPRPLLQSHIFHLLQEIGWSIEKRKRPSKKHMETIYRSPEGRLFREFPKAWRICGQTLLANEINFQQENAGKIWIGMSHFLSDLSDILMNIKKETDHLRFSNSWLQRWNLLDPFVTVVFIQKKIGALRRGNVIEAAGSLVIEKNKKEETTLASKVSDSTKCLLSQEHIPSDCSGSSLAARHSLPISETETSSQTHDDLKSKNAYGTGCFLSQDYFPSVHLAAKQLVPIPETETSCQTHDVGHEDNRSPGITNKMLPASKFDFIPQGSDTRSTNSAKLFEYVAETHNEGLRDSSSEVQEEKSETFEYPNPSGPVIYLQQLLNENRSLSAHCLIVPRQTEGTYERLEASSIKRANKKSSLQAILKRKVCPKSRKISECELMESDNTDTPLPGSAGKHGTEYTCTDNNDLNLEEIEDSVISKPSRELPMSSDSSLDQSNKRMLKKKRKGAHLDSFDRVQDTPKYQIQDDDLLVSAILRNKDPGSDASRSQSKCQKLRVQGKANSRKGGCKLRPRSMDRGSKHYSGFYNNVESRTVLAWLIVTDVISLNDIIQYQNSGDGAVIKEGLVTWNGVICQCCSNLLSISEFKIHAGFSLNRPCPSLFLASGKSFSLCQLQAWSFEYKRRKPESPLAEPGEHDPNDDSCGICGDGGELICCDNCPSSFHFKCLSMQELPEGSWYCSNCTCWICWNLTDDTEASNSLPAFQCSQCEHKYHEVCLKDKGACEVKISCPWFCDESCEQVYLGINSQLGKTNHISGGLSWTVLKCIHDDQKFPSAQRFALKAECNSKLAVALSILEECFQPMVDSRTGINMIPQVLYNWGSKFSRLNFGGFFKMSVAANIAQMIKFYWVAFYLVVSCCVGVLDASAGDADHRYRDCVAECVRTGCIREICFPQCNSSSDGPWYFRETIYLRWKQLDCQSDCRYVCMVDREKEREALGYEPLKYHGKWPFKRMFGLQEPASVALSALNLLMHLHGWISFFNLLYKRLPPKQDRKAFYDYASLWHIYALLSINSWFWSIIFHSWDVDLTEKLDYSSAVALLGFSLILAILRSFNVRNEAARVMVAAPLSAFFTTHILYLNFFKLDYGWNMKVCVITAVAQLLIWLVWAGVTHHPSRWKLWVVVIGGGLAMLLEIFDFPPYDGLLDAHALWHATTVPLTYIWWSFIRDDAKFRTSVLLKKAK